MSAPTPEKLAELRRLLDANEVPWSAHRPSPNYARYEIRDDRGYDLAYTVEDALGGNAEIIVAAVNALPALLDAAAERDRLAEAVERVRALHIAHDCTSHAGIATICAHRPGICLACLKPLPCPTIRALDTTPETGCES